MTESGISSFNANPANDIEFIDSTPSEIDTMDVSRVKAVLTTNNRSTTHTLVLIGEHANTHHRDAAKIGTRNWQWWAIEKSTRSSWEPLSRGVEILPGDAA